MKNQANFIIIDLAKEKAIHGVDMLTMRFTTRGVAREVADQLYRPGEKYIIVEILTENYFNYARKRKRISIKNRIRKNIPG